MNTTCFSYNLLTRFDSDGVTPTLEVIGHYSPCAGVQHCRRLTSVEVRQQSDSDVIVVDNFDRSIGMETTSGRYTLGESLPEDIFSTESSAISDSFDDLTQVRLVVDDVTLVISELDVRPGLMLETSVPRDVIDSSDDVSGILTITDANHGVRQDDGSYVTNVADGFFAENVASPQYFAQLFEDEYRHHESTEAGSGGSSLRNTESEVAFRDVDTVPLDEFSFTTAVRFNPNGTVATDDVTDTRVFEVVTSGETIEVVRDADEYTLTVTSHGSDTPDETLTVTGSTSGDWETVDVTRDGDVITLTVVDEDGNSVDATGSFPRTDDVIIDRLTIGDRNSEVPIDVDATSVTTGSANDGSPEDRTHNPPTAGEDGVVVEVVYEGTPDDATTPVIQTVCL